MANEEIVVDINADGSVTIEGKHFADGECLKATKELERDLGAVAQRTLKPEAHRTRVVTRKVGA